MKIKDGVIIAGLQLEMRPVIITADKIWSRHGQELVITSALDGEHSPGSYHPFGFALDFRTRYFDDNKRKVVAMELYSELKKLSTFYDCNLHSSHIHTEFDVAKAMEAGRFGVINGWREAANWRKTA